jgi:spore coat polysaccharide biosynthesis predicted glycosyltransferase SpsG
LGRSAEDYGGLLNPHAVTFIGPRFALLRPEFAQLRRQSIARRVDPRLKRLLITMGGVDKDNATGQVLQALSACDLPSELRITVVMGLHAPFLDAVQQQASQMPWPTQVIVGVYNVAQLMVDSDLCIGGAGGTAWERCCLGLPTLLLVLGDNQKTGAYALEKLGAALVLNTPQDIPQVFEYYVGNGALLRLDNMGQAALSVTEGDGVGPIVALIMAGQ